jgi:glycosyltransferase involved in cell wall biosynthesis
MNPQEHFGSKGLISILIPTRNRPKNVKRVVSSAFATASKPSKIEFLFYVDEDDKSFPSGFTNEKIKLISGPRIWISLALNVLYTRSRGEIIMYCGDDVVFRTKEWDDTIRNEFDKVPDKICLVHTNDGVLQSKDIARHGFLHRKWFKTLGSPFPALRGMPNDLWCSETATVLKRMRYIDDVIIEHVHYRQGGKSKLDSTYKDAYNLSRSLKIKKMYKKLSNDRRYERILLAEVMSIRPKLEKTFLLGELLATNDRILRSLSTGLSKNEIIATQRRLRSLKNYQTLSIILKYIPRLLFRKSLIWQKYINSKT